MHTGSGRRKPVLEADFSQEGTLRLKFTGSWRSSEILPSLDSIDKELSASPRPRRVVFDTTALSSWDSGFLTFLAKARGRFLTAGVEADDGGLPAGVRRLLALASAVPEREGARKVAARPSLLGRVGISAQGAGRNALDTLAFLGETVTALGALLRGKARFLTSDLALFTQECGARALPIVGLISFLVGVIFAFVGAVQLAMFGAEIYVADLVSLGMVRAMGAVMTAIVLAGRTGAAFAAQLGTMQVNEEIDALRTMGIPPMEFLVLPRLVALVLMTPLLCIYADLLGILGGAAVGIGMFDLGPTQYFQQTHSALALRHVWVGLFQSVVFGILVGLAGCLRGMQCGRSAWAVGAAATSAVVTGIVWIVTACALITMIFDVIGV